MRYLLLILLLAGGYYGWDYYQNGLVPRHEALKAMEQEPCPELDAAQARFDEAAELHEQQAARLQKAIQRKEEAVRKYWDARIKQAGQEKDGKKTAAFSMKNISAQSLNISADELTERFIRGDVSRSTEGSGLGLSIARNLTELQNGKFEIYLDGDLFKVILTFPCMDD